MSLFGGSGLPTSFLPPDSPYSYYHQEYLEEQAQQETNTITENPTPTTITTDDFLLQEENEDIIKDYLNIPEGSVLLNDLITIQNGYITIDASLLPTGDLVLALPTGEDLQIINEDTTTTIITYDENNTTITIEYNGYTYSIATQYITQEQITEVQTHTITNDDGDDAEVITTASLTALGHSNFDYHNYQFDIVNGNTLDIRLKYNYYFVDSNGVPTGDTSATKVYYTGMYQLNPNSGYDQHQHTIIDKNDTNIRTIKIPDASTLSWTLKVSILDGIGNIYINDTILYSNVTTSVSVIGTYFNHNDIIKIEYSHSENGSVVVSDTVEFKLLLQDFTEYIPRDLIQTNYNGNVITRSTQPIWYVRNNVIIINLEKLVDHKYIFNNPDSHSGYIPVFPHNYRPYNNGYFPEIAIPYQSGMKVKWLGLTSVVTPNGNTPSQLSIARASYQEETTGMFNSIIPAGYYHSSSYMNVDYEYDIYDGDPNGGDDYVGTYLKMEQNLDSVYKTAINVYFHKIPTPPPEPTNFWSTTDNITTINGTEVMNLTTNGNYNIVIPDEVHTIIMNDPYYMRNTTKNIWFNTGAYNQSFDGVNTQTLLGPEVYKWSVGDIIALSSSSFLYDPVYLTITNVEQPTQPTINSATEQFYDISSSAITLRPYDIVNNQLRFIFGTGSSEHYADIGGSYYLYVPDSITAINTTSSVYPPYGVYHRIGDDNMRGYKFRGTPWNIGDQLNIYETSTDNIIFTLVLTNDYSLAYAGAGLPVPAVYTDTDFWSISGDRIETRVYGITDTTMSLYGVEVNRGSNYYFVIPDEIDELKMNYPYWMRNITKDLWMNTGAYNQIPAAGVNDRGTNWDVNDILAIAPNGNLTDPVYLTITNVSG